MIEIEKYTKNKKENHFENKNCEIISFLITRKKKLSLVLDVFY